MASPALIDVEALLAPIAGETPAGESLPFSVRQQLDELRKEINPDLFDPDDPLRPDQPKPADWRGIINLGKQTLERTSKDLLVAARTLEALVKQHGFAGARDGLQLMRRLFSECWDRIYPSIEDGDLEVRATPFNWLDDQDRGARFPHAIRAVPLLRFEDQEYSWQTWRQIQDGKSKLKTADFEKAIDATTYEQAKTLADDLAAGISEVTQLIPALQEKLGEYAPGMVEVRNALEECSTLAKQILQKKGPAPGETAEEPAAGEEAPAEEGAPVGAPSAARRDGVAVQRMATREDVYRQLRDAANLLQKIEPHSPIPYLIQKAITLGAMPFPLLMKALIRDEGVLKEMSRELGIPEEEPAAEEG